MWEYEQNFRFVTIHAFNRPTDRRTDGRMLIAISRLHSCSTVKNFCDVYSRCERVSARIELVIVEQTYTVQGLEKRLGLGHGPEIKDLGLVSVWWSGVVVSAFALINEVNLRRARLVLRWATLFGFNSRCRTLISVCYQPATQSQLSLPSLPGR